MSRWTDALRWLRVASSSRMVGAAFLVLLALQGVMVQQGLARLRDIAAEFRFVVRDVGERERNTQAMQMAAQNRIVLLLRMLAQPDPLEREEDGRAFEAEGLAFGRARDALRQAQLDPMSRARLEDVLASAVELSQHQRKVVEQLLIGEDEAARQILAEQRVFAQQRELVQALQAFGDSQHALSQQAQARVDAAHASARGVLWSIGVGIFVLGIGLGVGVTRAISKAEQVLAQDKARADHAARHDPLTGLLNRRGFEHALAPLRTAAQADAARRQRRHSLLLIDLDRFKPINDQAGHAAGDAVLKRLADLFRAAVRPQDLVARLGGDEFAVVLLDLPAQAAVEVAERIRQTIQDFTFDWHGQRFQLGTSIGLVDFAEGTTDEAWSDVLKRADDACYQAKRSGRNRVCVA